MKCPAISKKLYNAMWNKLAPSDFDLDNATDEKLLEYLGWLDNYKKDKLRAEFAKFERNER